VRAFAQAVGKLAKTDKIDAVVIAEFAVKIPQKGLQKITESMLKVKSMVTRRRQLIEMRTAEICRLDHALDKFITKSINKTIKLFNAQIDAIEEEVKMVIDADPEMSTKAKIIKSVPGLSDGTAAVLVSELPELGTLNSKQIAALVGVAPIARESGKHKGKRITGGGRVSVRTQLYMPTLVAIQHNEPIREFYQRLLSLGKTKMTAVVACMRKIITIVNYMVARNECWKF
jgi:transposase